MGIMGIFLIMGSAKDLFLTSVVSAPTVGC